MSGVVNRPIRRRLDGPLFSYDEDLEFLEQSLYGHILRAIDFDALFRLEQLVWCELHRFEMFSDGQVLDLANALIARALGRAGHDPRRGMTTSTLGPGGELVAAEAETDEDCPFCRYELARRREQAAAGSGPS